MRYRVLFRTRSCLERAPTPQKFWRSFGVPAAFHFTFHLRSSNAFPVRLLLSGTVAYLSKAVLKSNCKHVPGDGVTHTKLVREMQLFQLLVRLSV